MASASPPRAALTAALALVLVLICWQLPLTRALPSDDFLDETLLTDLSRAISFRFLPDDRILLMQKRGEIFIVDATQIPALSVPYLTIANLNNFRERGALDLVLDPNFAANSYFYVYYSCESTKTFKLSRFLHQENQGGLTSRSSLASEAVIWENDDPWQSCCHYGGSLSFSPDNKLFITTGDQSDGSLAQDLSLLSGKILRINLDGTVPSDNFGVVTPGNVRDEIWSYGLRNPFTAHWDALTNRYFIAEVRVGSQFALNSPVLLVLASSCAPSCTMHSSTHKRRSFKHNAHVSLISLSPP